MVRISWSSSVLEPDWNLPNGDIVTIWLDSLSVDFPNGGSRGYSNTFGIARLFVKCDGWAEDSTVECRAPVCVFVLFFLSKIVAMHCPPSILATVL